MRRQGLRTEPAPGAVSSKFVEDIETRKAGPSTAFGVHGAPNFAQDDRSFFLNLLLGPHHSGPVAG
jgi:hypothetical protein